MLKNTRITLSEQDGEGNTLANAQVRYIKLVANVISDGVDPHKEMCYLIEDDVNELGAW